MVVLWAEKDSQEFMAVTPARTDLDRWVGLDKSVHPLMRFQQKSKKKSKAELLKWMVSGEDTIAYSSESTYAANLEMATNEYKAKQPCCVGRRSETRGNTRCQIY